MLSYKITEYNLDALLGCSAFTPSRRTCVFPKAVEQWLLGTGPLTGPSTMMVEICGVQKALQ